MTNTPLVSVLMAAYNVADYVREAIESVRQQQYQHWELLVADDGSTDATIRVVDEFDDPRIRNLPNPEHLGYLRTTNRLFGLARGELITFQDADDYSASLRLARQVQAFHDDPQLGLCGTWVALVDERGRAFAVQEKPASDDEIRCLISRRNVFCAASLMVRANVLHEIGGYREFFADYSHQDYDWASLAVDRFRAINVPEVLYFYRQRRGSNSKTSTPRRNLGFRLAQEFSAQRRMTGSDALMRGDLAAASRLADDLFRPYLADRSLGFRESAGQLLASRMHAEALWACARAIIVDPFRVLNYRTFLYCARRAARETARTIRRRPPD